MFVKVKDLLTRLELITGKTESILIKEARSELEKIEKDLSKDENEVVADVKKVKMGTVEPIRKEEDKVNHYLIGFVRGFVSKYKDANLDVKDVFNYLENLVK